MKRLSELEKTSFYQFSQLENYMEYSPEDKADRINEELMQTMSVCRNLDFFYDVVFELDGGVQIKANKAVLAARADYFRSMFSSNFNFKEYTLSKPSLGSKRVGRVRVNGIPIEFFAAIIQYLYTDHLVIADTSMSFYSRLLVYADYLSLGRLVDKCSQNLAQNIRVKNVLDVYLIAHAYNASQLEQHCIYFMAINEQEILES